MCLKGIKETDEHRNPEAGCPAWKTYGSLSDLRNARHGNRSDIKETLSK